MNIAAVAQYINGICLFNHLSLYLCNATVWDGRWVSLMTILLLVSVFLNHIQSRIEGVSL